MMGNRCIWHRRDGWRWRRIRRIPRRCGVLAGEVRSWEVSLRVPCRRPPKRRLQATAALRLGCRERCNRQNQQGNSRFTIRRRRQAGRSPADDGPRRLDLLEIPPVLPMVLDTPAALLTLAGSGVTSFLLRQMHRFAFSCRACDSAIRVSLSFGQSDRADRSDPRKRRWHRRRTSQAPFTTP
jgi:hypothetical protein